MMPEAEGSTIVTCWLPLGDSTVEMGCLQALPGITEEKGYLVHQKEGGTMIKPELMPDVEPLMLECYRGDPHLIESFHTASFRTEHVRPVPLVVGFALSNHRTSHGTHSTPRFHCA